MINTAELISLVNFLTLSSCFVLALSLWLIPKLPTKRDRITLKLFRMSVILLPLSYLCGSVQVVFTENEWIRVSSLLIANVGFTLCYYLILKAVTLKARFKLRYLHSHTIYITFVCVIAVSVLFRNDFVLRNTAMIALNGAIALTAFIVTLSVRRATHRGHRALSMAIGVVTFNEIATYAFATYSTQSSVEFSIIFATIMLTNCIVMTVATFSLYLNDIIEKTRKEAITDPLTGAFTRKLLTPAYNQTFERSFNGSMVICDIDHFKRINDCFGHEAGDRALKEFCRCISRNIRSSDALIRYGGEEFLILLKGATFEEAKERAEQMRCATEQLFLTYDKQEIRFTASFGVIEYKQNSAFEECIQRADALLYRAKSSGRNTVAASNVEAVASTV